MNQSSHLYQLQKIDTLIDKIDSRIIEIQNVLSSNIERTNAENDLNNFQEIYQGKIRKLKKIEDEVDSVRIKIEIDETALYSGRIQNPKELQDLQIEITSLKKRLSALEDETLDAMMDTEFAENEVTNAQKFLNDVIENFSSQNEILNQELKSIDGEMKRLHLEREATLASVSKENQKIYEKLRTTKKGLAVVEIEDFACKGCGASLRPAEVQNVRSPHTLTNCSSCGRILYAD